MLWALKRGFIGSEASDVSYDALDYMHTFGTPLEALLYSRLFAPKIAEIGKGIFFEQFVGNYDVACDEIENAETMLQVTALERRYNRVVLTNNFSHWNLNEAEDTVLLSEELIRAWRGWLKGHYPDENFIFNTLPFDEGIGVETIYWWTDRGFTPEQLNSADIPDIP